jgi:hypothetical protein
MGDVLPSWNPAHRIVFRFLFVYLILYILPFPLSYVSLISSWLQPEIYLVPSPLRGLVYVGIGLQQYQRAWYAFVPWVGKHVFGVEITVFPAGSGDTTYNYVHVFCLAVISAAVAALWTLCDRKHSGYPRLHYGLRVYVRFWLATTMLSYGSVKVIKSQFPNPSLDRLLQPFGDASPMGLLWTFMGASESYNIFTGAGEMLGGLLLTTRRTTLLGALVCVGVLSNIVMLNFSYDVPVKLFSLHLLFAALMLIAPDWRRLAGFLMLNRTVARAPLGPQFRARWLHRSVLVVRTLLVVACVIWMLHNAQQSRKRFGDLALRSPLQGIWNVEELKIDGAVRPPLVTDPLRWRRVVFDYPGMLAIQQMNDSRSRYALTLDAGKKTIDLSRRDQPAWKSSFSYTEPEPEVLVLEGSMDGKKIQAKLRRQESSSFLLVSRGFHWINEYPFNR